MNFEAVIGLEIHVELKTKTKMFSGAAIDFMAAPNTLVCPVDMAFPGTMPVVNKHAIECGILLSNALNMQIEDELWFDRKNYFYSDLPKGYQITQDKRPIGRNGYLEMQIGDKLHRIGIERLHLEEDTAMQHHFSDYTLLDYNRAGIPLAEIVSHPEIHSGTEAMKYVETIRQIVVFLNVSDGKMEEGSLRCDVNISLRLHGEKKFGVKVEIKNLNSIANIEKAIDYEMRRQEQILLSGGKIVQETRRYDEAKKATVRMRLKTDAIDYKYFTEPNIIPIRLSKAFKKQVIDSAPELASAKRVRYIETFGLNSYDADLILQSKELALYFDEAVDLTANYKLLANWLNGEVAAYLNKQKININQLSIKPNRLSALVDLIEAGTISNAQARRVFELMLNDEHSPLEIAKAENMMQISDESALIAVIEEVLSTNEQSIADYRAGKDRAVGFLVGQIMRKTQGKANPALASKLLLIQLKKRI